MYLKRIGIEKQITGTDHLQMLLMSQLSYYYHRHLATYGGHSYWEYWDILGFSSYWDLYWDTAVFSNPYWDILGIFHVDIKLHILVYRVPQFAILNLVGIS